MRLQIRVRLVCPGDRSRESMGAFMERGTSVCNARYRGPVQVEEMDFRDRVAKGKLGGRKKVCRYGGVLVSR